MRQVVTFLALPFLVFTFLLEDVENATNISKFENQPCTMFVIRHGILTKNINKQIADQIKCPHKLQPKYYKIVNKMASHSFFIMFLFKYKVNLTI